MAGGRVSMVVVRGVGRLGCPRLPCVVPSLEIMLEHLLCLSERRVDGVCPCAAYGLVHDCDVELSILGRDHHHRAKLCQPFDHGDGIGAHRRPSFPRASTGRVVSMPASTPIACRHDSVSLASHSRCAASTAAAACSVVAYARSVRMNTGPIAMRRSRQPSALITYVAQPASSPGT